MLKPYTPLIVVLVALGFVIAFALNNGMQVPVWVLGFRLYLPLVWVIVGSFLAGLGVGVAASLRRQFHLAAQLRALQSATTVSEASADGAVVAAAAEAIPAGGPAAGAAEPAGIAVAVPVPSANSEPEEASPTVGRE
jgi:uncharacterized integral membrane protein